MKKPMIFLFLLLTLCITLVLPIFNFEVSTVHANPDGWVNPTSHSGGSSWNYPTNFYDDNETTYAESNNNPENPPDSISLLHSALQCSKVRLKLNFPFGDYDYLKVEIHKDGSWITLYEGGTWITGWNEYSFTEGSVDAMRVTTYYTVYGFYSPVSCYEADFLAVPEYSNPLVTSEITWYMRSDSHTVNTITGYSLSESATSTSTTVTTSDSGNLTVFYGWRVYKVSSKGTETQLTTDIIYSWRIGDGEGLQNVLWTCPETTLLSTDAIEVKFYIKLAGGDWQKKATFISNKLGEVAISSTQWAFQTYTKRSTSGGTTTGYGYWGDSSHKTVLCGIKFVEGDVYDTMTNKFESGDFIGFVLFPYLNLIGSLFYGIWILIMCVPLYNRYKSFVPILIALILFGGAGGIGVLLIPNPALQIVWLFALGCLAGLLWKVFR